MTSDDRDEYDCPAPRVPGPVVGRLNRSLGAAWANAWLTLLVGTARWAHLLAGQRRDRDTARQPQVAARGARPSGDLGDEMAVARARRAYT